jgi:hypothetical protein
MDMLTMFLINFLGDASTAGALERLFPAVAESAGSALLGGETVTCIALAVAAAAIAGFVGMI